jgi:hypothetical protein
MSFLKEMYHHTLQVLPPVPKIEVRLEPHHKALPVGTVSAVSLVLNSECPYELFFGFVGEQKTAFFPALHSRRTCFSSDI